MIAYVIKRLDDEGEAEFLLHKTACGPVWTASLKHAMKWSKKPPAQAMLRTISSGYRASVVVASK